jgi:hypothetical protein
LASLAVAASISVVSALPAAATNFSFEGTFSGDADVQIFTFSVANTSNVTLRTLSYAGSAGVAADPVHGTAAGVNAAGNVIARGGFDPILAVFNSAGVFINQNDDGGDPLVPADAVSNNNWDTYLNVTLAPGTYSVSVMQYDNFAVGSNLSDGFTYPSSDTNFTSQWCTADQFCDVVNRNPNSSLGARDNHWAFDVLGVDTAVVVPRTSETPIPGALPLFASGLGVIGLMARRRKRKQA